MKPTAYIIAATPRSGSNYLCGWLRNCGAGNAREWLNKGLGNRWADVMRDENPPNVRAAKIFYHHAERYMRHAPDNMLDLVTLEMYRVAPVKWVYLTRRDKVR